MEQELVHELNNVFAVALPPAISEADLEYALSQQINHLIQHDFSRLIAILYRIDVPEQKLKQILKENTGTDAGLIIARMMIERQRQKIKAREAFKTNTGDSTEEKW